MAKYLLALVLIVVTGRFAQGNSIFGRKETSTRCGDWVPYEDEKCVKVSITAGVRTQEEAEAICDSYAEELKLETRPTLVVIGTREKQEFLQQLLFVENKLVDNVWLGLKENGGKNGVYEWADESSVVYSNWAKQNISDNHHQCVEISSGEGGFGVGQWVKVNCMKSNIVVCERGQSLTLEKLQVTFLKYQLQQEKVQKETGSEINSLKKRNSEAEKLIKLLKQKSDEAFKNIEILKQRNAAEDELISVLMKNTDALKNNITALKQNNDGLGKRVTNLEQRCKTAEQNVGNLRVKLEAAEKNVVSLKQKAEDGEKTVTALKQRNDAAEKNVNDLKQKNSATEKIIASLKQQNEAAEKTITTLKQKDVVTDKEIAALKQRFDSSDKAVAALKQRNDGAEKTINEQKQKQEAAEKNALAIKQKSDVLEKNLNALTQKNAAAEANIGALTQKNQAAQNEINNMKINPVPVGFIYVELPGQQPPTTLWPRTKWAEVSSKYAGLFFRVVGGGAAPFGQIQEGDNPSLEQVEQTGGLPVKVEEVNPVTIPRDGSWSKYFWDGQLGGENIFMRFHLSRTEVRPRNQAIKIWQRIN